MPATCRKKALGFERGHAAGASCGDCLTIDFVHNVATREHAQSAGSRRARYHLDVAVTIEGMFSCEQLSSRLVAYGPKPPVRRERKSVVQGQVVSLRVFLGGRRILHKQISIITYTSVT